VFGALIILILYSSTSMALTASVSNFVVNADASLNSNDTIQSYRSFVILEQVKPKQFYKLGLEGYLKSLFIIGTESLIQSECDRFSKLLDKSVSAKARYLCGLEYTEEKNPGVAANYLLAIDLTSTFYWPAQILLSTDDLLKDQAVSALNRLVSLDAKIYKKFKLEDLFYLTRARSLLTLNKFSEALRDYQFISSSSPYYVDALQEMAFVFYKQKNFNAAYTLIDVIKTEFEQNLSGRSKLIIPSAMYLQVRYLEAYSKLVDSDLEHALTEFEELKNEVKQFESAKGSDRDANLLANLIRKNGNSWSDERDFPLPLEAQLLSYSYLLAPGEQRKIKRLIQLYLAYTHELTHVEHLDSTHDDKNLGSYKADLQNLGTSVIEQIRLEFLKDNESSTQALNSVGLKARLGKLEVATIQRAHGVKSLDDVIQDYLLSIRQMDELAYP
jgi:hypothetical protein